MKQPARISLAMKAVRGAAWTIATGIGSRAFGLVGTLGITYFIARDDLGEVSDAAILVVLANQFSTLGVGQYYIAAPDAGRKVAWHATLVHVLLGFAAIAAIVCFERPLAGLMKAPALSRYLPGLALSGVIDRFAYMPERVLAREMKFRVVSVCRTAAELTYTAVSVVLAAMGWGAMSIVAANVARSIVRLLALLSVVPRADWLTPTRISLPTVRAMLRFGAPVSVGTAAGFASRRVDNAIVSGLFGVNVVGAYNLAYNVADVPAVQVGEQIGDVLLPSFAKLDPASRKAALVRSTGLLALVTFPLAVGLGAIAQPLVDTLLKPEWHDVGPMLAMLSGLSVTRPIGWTISAYLLARDKTRIDAVLEVFKLVALVGLLFTVGRISPLWACAGVGGAFALHALASMAIVQLVDDVRVSALVARCTPPLVACIPMVLAIRGVHFALSWGGIRASWLHLVTELLVGALVYPVAALIVAQSTARDMIDLLRRARHQRPSSTESTVSSSDICGVNPST